MPSAAQGLDGNVTMTLGAKGVVELELVSSGERWGRGPQQDVHSSNKARARQPRMAPGASAGHAGSPDGNDPAIEGFADKARPLSRRRKGDDRRHAAQRLDEDAGQEAARRRALGPRRRAGAKSLELLVSRPTVNIEGLVGGYTGPGGKTILPARAVAKIDLRLVPDMTAAEARSPR